MLVFFTPWMRDLHKSQKVEFTLHWPRLLAALGLFAAFVFLGGSAAIFIGGATQPKHAISYGLGWETVLKAAVNPPRKPSGGTRERKATTSR